MRKYVEHERILGGRFGRVLCDVLLAVEGLVRDAVHVGFGHLFVEGRRVRAGHGVCSHGVGRRGVLVPPWVYLQLEARADPGQLEFVHPRT